MISQLDIFFRIGNTVLLVLLAMVLIKDHYRRPSAVLGAIIALGAAAIGTFEYTLEWGWLVLEIPLNLFCAAAPVAFWLLSKSLFEVVILVITFAEFFNLGTPRSILVSTIVSGFFFLLILGIYLHFLGFRRGQPDQPLPLEIPSQRSIEVDVEEGDAPGAEIIEELERLMVEKRLFCEEGLTIGRLAERLEIKEYLLRRMINGHLGYRNYNQFLNRYRIEEAAKLLLAPKTRHLPVLTIALDVGYRSLTVFNKAFKETMNMTPSEFRKCRKAETPLVD